MKNFKLLLATTAILSTGLAMGVRALPALPDATASLKVQIKLYNAAGITVEQDMINFGVLAATGDHTEASVRLDPESGLREITPGKNVVAADSGNLHKVASLYVNIPEGYTATLSLPTNVTLYNEDSSIKKGYTLNFKPEKYLDDNWTEGTLNLDFYYIGGSINLSGEFRGSYDGSFVVTAVYTEDTTSGSGGE